MIWVPLHVCGRDRSRGRGGNEFFMTFCFLEGLER